MLRVRQIKVPINDDNITKYLSYKLKISEKDILFLKINKKSIDARKKEQIYFVYEVDIDIKNEQKYLKNQDVLIAPLEKYTFKIMGKEKIRQRPIIIGAGPAGLFCAYLLAKHGYKPLIIERGQKIEDRVKSVEKFWQENKLNTESNIQFGEGGAGTFSDGKLNTLVKDKNFRMKKVFEIFVSMGAPQEILYLNKPHIGTDLLRKVIINMRKKIISMGGEFRYNSLMTDINIKNGQIESIIVNNKKIKTDTLVLAIGHSSRDTFKMLYEKNIEMQGKSFAVGVRVSHKQELINKNQYNNAALPPASYKLTYQTAKKRGVYSFCMCPGGYVINASSENEMLVVNGMSNHDRNSGIANSAIIVTVSPKDFGTHPLDGITFQKDIESKAYKIGKGKIPVQNYNDFKDNKMSKSIQNYKFKGDYTLANLNEIFPDYINDSLKEGIEHFDQKIKGFKNTVLAAPESRTSSPVRIIRNDVLEANIKGIYPCGEGAGYAGGITTSAMDGIKIAEKIAQKYKPF